MSRLIGIVCLGLGIWVGLEVYQHGVGGAFGGLFGDGLDVAESRSPPQRAADAFQRAYDRSVDRVDRQLDPEDRER